MSARIYRQKKKSVGDKMTKKKKLPKPCPVCFKEYKSEEARRKHMLSSHPKHKLTKTYYPIPETQSDLENNIRSPVKRMIDIMDPTPKNLHPDTKTQLEMQQIQLNQLNDTLEFMFRNMPNSFNKSNPYSHYSISEGSKPPEDEFDKALTRMMKVMMIKQLMGNNEGSFIGKFMQMSDFLDKKYDQSGGGELQTLISAFLGSGIFNKSESPKVPLL